MHKVLVLGSGVFGTSMASLLSDNKHDVTLWGRDEEKIKFLNNNKIHFNNSSITIPDSLKVKCFLENEKFDFIILAVSAQAVRDVLDKFKNFFHKEVIIVILSKGIETSSLKRLSQVIEEQTPGFIVALYGPTHALGIANKEISLLVSSSNDQDKSLRVKKLFENNFLKVKLNDDLIGAEFAAALKNYMAIAYGIMEGLKVSYNTKAALITEALEEMVNISSYFGAKCSTFLTALGIGDLFVTCNSGRNRALGEKLGKGLKINEIVNNKSEITEGIETIKAVYELCKRKGIEAKITNLIYSIIYENRDAETILEFINK